LAGWVPLILGACMLGLYADTASAADSVWKVPANVPDELAAWVFVLGVGELALRRAEEAGALQFGATVGIVGLGMVGLSSLAYCNTYGFRSVCVDPVTFAWQSHLT
jgi:threonine dehydrogenase-like Zn-dependent dehydrogenase